MRIFAAILLLPFCFGTAQGLIRVIKATGNAESTWVALGAGMACWVVIYLSLPKPMWAYVLGHELTHVLWAYLFGGRVKKMRITSRGGHVILTRKNSLIALAPYFFPLYAIVVVVCFAIGHWIWDWQHYLALFHLLLGAAYAFHLTLTWWVLRTEQSDIVDQGYLFSAVLIWLGNALVLIVGLPLLTGRVSLLTAIGWCWIATGEVMQKFGHLL